MSHVKLISVQCFLFGLVYSVSSYAQTPTPQNLQRFDVDTKITAEKLEQLLRGRSFPSVQPDLVFPGSFDFNDPSRTPNSSFQPNEVMIWNKNFKVKDYEGYLKKGSDTHLRTRKLFPIYKQEVEPDTATPTIIKISFRSPKPASAKILRELTAPGEVRRQKKCGSAVRGIRKSLSMEWGEINGITNFNELCLADKPWAKKVSLNQKERKMVGRCQNFYTEIVSNCFSSEKIDTVLENRVKSISGVLIVPPKSPKGSKRIICSATIVGRFHVITARHCLREVASFQQSVKKRKLLFMPYNQHGVYNIKAVRLAPKFGRISIQDYQKLSKIGHGGAEHDIAILETEKYIGAPIDGIVFPEFSGGNSGDKVRLAAFQRLIARAFQIDMLLKQGVVPDDDLLLKTGAWRNALVSDATPTCILLEYKNKQNLAGVLGHMCQSLQGGSGGAIIKDDPTSTTLQIAAIHVGAAPQQKPGPVVEANQPKNIAVVTRPALNLLVAKFEEEKKLWSKDP